MAAETATSKATRPAPRTRATTAKKATTSKATPAKAAVKEVAEESESTSAAPTRPSSVVEFVYVRDTKNYAVFQAPEEMDGVVTGSVYAPLGTDAVKVAIYGMAEAE